MAIVRIKKSPRPRPSPSHKELGGHTVLLLRFETISDDGVEWSGLRGSLRLTCDYLFTRACQFKYMCSYIYAYEYFISCVKGGKDI